jgi:hypothetical protein
MKDDRVHGSNVRYHHLPLSGGGDNININRDMVVPLYSE